MLLVMEARVGIEPTNGAFAEPSLTTWLPRHHSKKVSTWAVRDLNPRPTRCKRAALPLS